MNGVGFVIETNRKVDSEPTLNRIYKLITKVNQKSKRKKSGIDRFLLK